MKHLKKASVLALCLCIAVSMLAFGACSKTENSGTDSGKIKVVCTIFPEYDWVKQILGINAENAEITFLLESGVDLHNYQPTADDLIKIADCDLFIYAGGLSDNWVDDTLAQSKKENRQVIDMLETIGDSAKEEEIVEGMQAEEEEEGEIEYDEHTWLSLKNAKVVCEKIAVSLGEIDPDNKQLYLDNYSYYAAELDALDSEYKETVDSAKNKVILFGDRFPFRYLADDYGLTYYAAFVGCSAETEASFETISFLAKKVDELSLGYVLTIEKSDNKIAQTIIDNTSSKNQKILALNSMQSTTLDEANSGATYLSIMKDNLEVLKTALN